MASKRPSAPDEGRERVGARPPAGPKPGVPADAAGANEAAEGALRQVARRLEELRRARQQRKR